MMPLNRKQRAYLHDMFLILFWGLVITTSGAAGYMIGVASCAT